MTLLQVPENKRELAGSAPERLRFAGFTLDLAGRLLLDQGGQEVTLRRSEFALLLALVRSPGRALSRDYLLESIAGRSADAFDRSIDVLVGRLRKKIEAEPKVPRLILTVPGVGYKFIAKPRAVSEPETNGGAGLEKPPDVLPRPAERRQLTVLHCTLSGLASLSAQRDPEDLQQVVTTFHTSFTEVVTQAGGMVAQLLSEGAVAYFGYPQAHEHDAERAVRAALSLIDTVRGVGSNFSAALHARIGIATGLVIAGDLSGTASAEPAALGEAPCVAAGLRALAAPDAVLIAASTRRLLGGLFECRACGPLPLDSVAEPVAAWQITGEGSAEGRFEALHGTDIADLVGRSEEMRLLLRRWEQAKAGAGSVVLITGEPGIGKSRLAAALQDRLRNEPHLRLRRFCSPHHQDSALYPVITQLERACGFLHTDSAGEKLARLEAVLAQFEASVEEIALIAALLSIPNGEHYPLPQTSPQKRREKTLAALLAQLLRLASRQPMLLIYEDAHWIDPTTLELLAHTVERVASLPVLLLITARPEFRPPWPEEAHVTTLPLNRLSRTDAAALVDRVTGGRALPDAALEQLLARTGGIPLFIEELTKMLLESGLLVEEQGRFVLTGPLPPLAIPATLHDSLLARLDRLGASTRSGADRCGDRP
jgi:class 3 adenylate cyclase